MGIRDRLKGKLKAAMGQQRETARPRTQRQAASVGQQTQDDTPSDSGMTRPRTVDETATTRRLAALVGDDAGLALPEAQVAEPEAVVEEAPAEVAPEEPEEAPAPDDTPSPEPPSEDDVETWSVHLKNDEEELDKVIECEEGETVLDAADRQGVVLPSSCRAGGCYVCAGILVSGELHQEEQYVLEDEHLEEGFRLLCSSWPTSDVVVLTHQNDNVT